MIFQYYWSVEHESAVLSASAFIFESVNFNFVSFVIGMLNSPQLFNKLNRAENLIYVWVMFNHGVGYGENNEILKLDIDHK